MFIVTKIVPRLLLISGALVMAASSIGGGGNSAYVGLPLFMAGFLWLLFPVIFRHKGDH